MTPIKAKIAATSHILFRVLFKKIPYILQNINTLYGKCILIKFDKTSLVSSETFFRYFVWLSLLFSLAFLCDAFHQSINFRPHEQQICTFYLTIKAKMTDMDGVMAEKCVQTVDTCLSSPIFPLFTYYLIHIRVVSLDRSYLYFIFTYLLL